MPAAFLLLAAAELPAEVAATGMAAAARSKDPMAPRSAIDAKRLFIVNILSEDTGAYCGHPRPGRLTTRLSPARLGPGAPSGFSSLKSCFNRGQNAST
jgi:hypothetical protein